MITMKFFEKKIIFGLGTHTILFYILSERKKNGISLHKIIYRLVFFNEFDAL